MSTVLFDFTLEYWPAVLLSGLPALLNLGILLYIWLKLPRNRLTLTFALTVFAIFLWQLSSTLQRLSDPYAAAYTWQNLLWFGSILAAPAGLHFALYFTGRQRLADSSGMLAFLYVPPILFEVTARAGLNWHPLKHDPVWNWVMEPTEGFLSQLEVFWIAALGFVVFILLALYAWRMRNNPERQIQAILIGIGFGVPTLQGTLTQAIMPYVLGLSEVPVTSTFMTIFSVVTVIALSRYHLFSFSPEYATRHILQTMSDGLCVVDSENRIQYFNNRFQTLTGYSTKELTQMQFNDLLLDNQDYESNVRIFFLRKQGRETQHQILLRTKSGERRWVLMDDSPIFSRKDEVEGTISILKDFTQQKEAEEALMRRNKELNTFIYATSHDLKSPLRGISSISTWLKEELETQLDEDQKRQFDLLVSRTHRLHHLLEGILEYAKVGRQDTHTVPVASGRALEEVVESLELPSTISIKVPEEMPVVEYPSGHLETIFRHLLQNAIDHSGTGTNEVAITFDQHNGKWWFIISDQGRGIPTRYHEKVFQMFQTLEENRHTERIGLGLPLVKKIVEQNGGEIWIESKEDNGTKVHFSIPVEE